MLRVNPRERQDCGRLLETLDNLKPGLDVAASTENYSLIQEEELEIDMLATINLPKDLKLLGRRLPKSNYAKKNSQKHKEFLNENPDDVENSRVMSGLPCTL